MTTADTAPRFRYTVVVDGAAFAIHAAGCSHSTKNHNGRILGNCTGTRPEAVAKGMARNMADNGRTEADFRIMGCCDHAPQV